MNASLIAQPDLWSALRRMAERMRHDIGAPAAVAAMAALSRGGRRAILEWLAPLERLVRKLLVAEAALLPRPRAPALSAFLRPVTPANRMRAAAPLDPAAPESWRVRFSLTIPTDRLQPPPAPCRARIRSLDPILVREIWARNAAPTPRREASPRVRGPLRLALRLEALRRVIANPAPHVLRLARKLWAMARAAAAAVRRIAGARLGRRSWWFEDGADIEATRRGRALADVFADSG